MAAVETAEATNFLREIPFALAIDSSLDLLGNDCDRIRRTKIP
jgi:hypothetical protein